MTSQLKELEDLVTRDENFIEELQNLKEIVRGNSNQHSQQHWSLLLKQRKQTVERTLKNGAEHSRDFPDRAWLMIQKYKISKVLDYAACKTEQPNGQITATL